MQFILGIILGVVGIAMLMGKIQQGGRDSNHVVQPKSLKGIASIMILIAAGMCIFSLVRVVPAGNVGVIDVFGSVSMRVVSPGINLVNPFATVVLFSTKTHEIKEVMQVPSEEGLSVKLDASVLYRIQPDKAPMIYKTLGIHFDDVVLVPQFRAASRGATVSYEAKALYTSSREQIAAKVQSDLQQTVTERGIIVETVLLRSIELPAMVSGAIEIKLRAEQESDQMKFVLEKERQEADRKKIEAEGIRNFQRIVNEGLTEDYLKWKGIEATEKLASSTNAKVVIIGNNKNGLPIILGDGK